MKQQFLTSVSNGKRIGTINGDIDIIAIDEGELINRERGITFTIMPDSCLILAVLNTIDIKAHAVKVRIIELFNKLVNKNKDLDMLCNFKFESVEQQVSLSFSNSIN